MLPASPAAIHNAEQSSSNLMGMAQSPACETNFATSKSFMSPSGSGPSWAPPGSTKQVRRTLMCSEDMGSMGAGFTSIMGSPHTPSMQVLCFGEHEVSANTTPTTIGALGDFARRPDSGSSSATRPLILAGGTKKKVSKAGNSNIRRDLSQNLGNISPPITKNSTSSAHQKAGAVGASGHGTASGTRSKAKGGSAQQGNKPPPPSQNKGGALSGASGGMLAALGAMPPLGGMPGNDAQTSPI